MLIVSGHCEVCILPITVHQVTGDQSRMYYCATKCVHQVTGDQSRMYHCATQCAQISGLLSAHILSWTSDGSTDEFCIRCVPRKKPRHSSLCTPDGICVSINYI